MDNERLTHRERQDVLMFLGALALALAIVAIVALARLSWSQTNWTGLAAIATAVQAIGVLAALGYATLQVRTAQAIESRRRQDERLNNLAAIVSDRLWPTERKLEAAMEDLRRAWLNVEDDRDGLWVGPATSDDLSKEYSECFWIATDAWEMAERANAAALRAASALGDGSEKFIRIHHTLLAILNLISPFHDQTRFETPIGGWEPWRGPREDAVAAKFRSALQEAEGWVTGLLADAAPLND